MDRFSDVVADKYGRGISNASVLVKISGGPTATIFADRSGTPMANPFNADALGNFTFCAADGLYDINVYIGTALVGTIRDVRLDDPNDVTGTKVYVVVLTGQSNAAGARNGGPNPANPLVKVWDGVTHAWGSSDYTQAPFSRTYPDGNNANNNVGLAFAHRLADETGGHVFVVYDAYGGRPIEDWMGTGTASIRYVGIKTKVEAALASAELVAAGKTQIDYLIYAQGEENALTDDFPTYRAKFVTLDNQFRAETWMTPTTPMFVMGMSELHKRYQVWQAQLDYCEGGNRNCVYVNSSGLKTAYEVGGSQQLNLAAVTGFAVNDTVTSGGTTGTVTAVGASYILVSNVGGIFTSGAAITSTSGGNTTIASLDIYSDGTHWLGNSLWEHGYHRIWYASRERAMSHRSQSALFYGRSAGPSKTGDSTALAMFSSIVSNGSLTTTFPPNGPSATHALCWGFQCTSSNYSGITGYQNAQNSLARYSFMSGRSNIANSGADYHQVGGFQNTANNTYQTVGGRGNSPMHSGETVFGLFSKYVTTQTDPILFQIGNGTTTSNRKNVFAVRQSGIAEMDNLPVYSDNTAATTGGLLAGQLYRTATGVLMARF